MTRKPSPFIGIVLLLGAGALRAQGELTVTVETLGGDFVPQAQVCLFPPEAPPGPGSLAVSGGRDGIATFPEVAAGSYWLIVSAAGAVGRADEIDLGPEGDKIDVVMKPGDPADGPLCRRPPEIVELTVNDGADTVLPLTFSTFRWSTSSTLLAPMEYRFGEAGAMDITAWQPVPDNDGTATAPSYEQSILLGGDPGDHTYGIQMRYAEDPALASTVATVTVALGEPGIAWAATATVPEVLRFEINSGAPATSFAALWLEWSTRYTGAEAVEYRVAEDPSFAGVGWKPVPSATGWILQPSYATGYTLNPAEPNVVYLQVRYAGETDPDLWGGAQAGVTYVPPTPLAPLLLLTGFTVNDGEASTDDREVTLRWTSTMADAPLEYRVRESGAYTSCVGGGWKDAPGSQEDDYTLALGPAGERTIYFQLRRSDDPGVCSSSATDSIELESETYEIGGAHAVAFAFANGWEVGAATPPSGPHQIDCSINDDGGEDDPAWIGTYNWSPGEYTCHFTLFGGPDLNDGWTYEGFSGEIGGYEDCEGGDVGIFAPDAGDASPQFDIHLTAPPSLGAHPGRTLLHTECVYLLETLELSGPADTDWENAFIQFSDD